MDTDDDSIGLTIAGFTIAFASLAMGLFVYMRDPSGAIFSLTVVLILASFLLIPVVATFPLGFSMARWLGILLLCVLNVVLSSAILLAFRAQPGWTEFSNTQSVLLTVATLVVALGIFTSVRLYRTDAFDAGPQRETAPRPHQPNR